MVPEDKSKIEELKKSLYSRNAPDVRAKRRLHFSSIDTDDVKADWDHPAAEEGQEVVLNKRYSGHNMSFFTKLLVGSAIFFVITLGIGIYLVLNGTNIISADNIDIVISGPATVAGGSPVSFGVQVNNKNNVTLQTVDMDIDFPSGTVDPNDSSKELKEYRQLMDDISPGGIGQKDVSAVIYGEENTKKEILVNISYRVAGSNAIFKKQKAYEVLISSSPLSLIVSSFKEVTSGQEFEFEVTLSSNSEEVIGNLLLKASYPFGFSFISSDISSAGNTTAWRIGDIPPKGKKIVKFKGELEGQDDEIRVFKFTVGAQSTRNSDTIGTEYIATTQEISIKKPFITTTINFDDDTGDGGYVGSFNSPIRVSVSWFNNLPVSIIDGEIHAKLSGNSFDKVSVNPGTGYYKSADNEIVWNKITTSELANIGPGEEGTIYFYVTPRDFSTPLKSMTNPGLSVDISVQGKRLSESDVQENIASSAKRSVRISSNLSLSAAIVRSQGPFVNTGPIPPRAEKQTTYTVLWTVDNTSNTVTDAEIKTLLPAYVKWLGKTSPVGENISYNSNNGEVIWKIGNVDARTPNSSNKRQVAFSIAIEPSVAQIGQTPLLVQEMTLTGQDDFTGKIITKIVSSLNTNFSTDPAFKDGNGVVAP